MKKKLFKLNKLLPITLAMCLFCSFVWSQNPTQFIQQYNDNLGSREYSYKAYYYEVVRQNNQIAFFADADGILFSLGTRYLIDLAQFSFIQQNTRKSNGTDQWLNFLKRSNVGERSYIQNTHQPMHVFLLNAFRRLESRGPLNPQNFRRYNYKLEKPRDAVPHILVSPKRGSDFVGKLYLNPTSNQIDSLDFEKCQWFCTYSGKVVSGWLKVVFAHQRNTTIPITFEGGFSNGAFSIHTLLARTQTQVKHHTYSQRPRQADRTNNNNLEIRIELDHYGKNPIVNYNPDFWNGYTANSRLLPRELAAHANRQNIKSQFSENHQFVFMPHFNSKINQMIDKPNASIQQSRRVIESFINQIGY